MKKFIFAVLILSAILEFVDSAAAQSNTRKAKKTAAKKTAAAKTMIKPPDATSNKTSPAVEETSVKKNERPTENAAAKNVLADGAGSPETGDKVNEAEKPNARTAQENKVAPVYFYTFSQPEFLVSKIRIEHDENGRGKISFQKRDFGDFITDPLQLSPAALERVKAILSRLNFLESKENYQSPERNYAHLGTMTFAVKKDAHSGTAEFNWTENKDAKLLADEYRRISQQFVWIFDINTARENQPLESPALMDALDSMIKRNEISDAAQMLPLLAELSTDERLPLIARNHAARIIKTIEKSKK